MEMLSITSDLPIIQTETNELMVNARDLHSVLKVGRDFSNWIKDRIQKYGFSEGKDFSPNLAKTSGENGGRPSIEYILSLSMAKELAMVENNEIGRAIRLRLIKIEEAWNQEDMVVARAMMFMDRKMKHQKSLIDEMKPKAEFHDYIVGSENCYSITEAIHALKIPVGRNKFFEILRNDHVLRENNEPYQSLVDANYFTVTVKETAIGPKAVTIITGKGLAWLSKKYNHLRLRSIDNGALA